MIAPYATVFRRIATDSLLASQLRCVPEAFSDLSGVAPTQAGLIFKRTMDDVFLPTQQSLAILRSWIAAAELRASENYPTPSAILSYVYENLREESCPPASPFALTGLAGVGKSALSKALLRLIAAPVNIRLEHHSEALPLDPFRSVQLRSAATVKQMYLRLTRLNMLGVTEDEPKVVSESSTRQRLWKTGALFFSIDEFQFVSSSAAASSLAAKILLSATYLSVPCAFVSNFDMLHKLSRRPSQEQHRLLSQPQHLHQDPPESSDWSNFLVQCEHALGATCTTSLLLADPDRIWMLTAGIKRSLVELLKQAVEARGRRPIDDALLDRTFRGSAFTAHRIDIELLCRHSRRGDALPEHLRSPFIDTNPVPEAVAEALVRARRNYAAQVAVQGSFSPRERRQIARANPLPASMSPIDSSKTRGKKLDRSLEALTAAAKTPLSH